MDTTPNKELAEHSLGCRDSLKNRLFSFPLLTLAHFSYYDIGMNETIDKKKVTEEQIAVWIDEAEKGYDVNVLKKRGRGRPGRGASPSQVVAVRLTSEELEYIDRKAAEQNLTRSEYIRRSLTA